MLWVRSNLLLEEPDRLVPIPEQRVGEGGAREELTLRIELRVVGGG